MPVLVVGLNRGVLAVQLGLPSLRRQQHPQRVPRSQGRHQIFQPPQKGRGSTCHGRWARKGELSQNSAPHPREVLAYKC